MVEYRFFLNLAKEISISFSLNQSSKYRNTNELVYTHETSPTIDTIQFVTIE